MPFSMPIRRRMHTHARRFTIALGLVVLNAGCQSATDGSSQESYQKTEEVSSELISNPASASRNAREEEKMRADMPQFAFENERHDFGALEQGEKVMYTFTFKNDGPKPLIINHASASCGCTVPSYPTQPIAPGQTGEIEVVFDSSGKSGAFQKTITLKANTYPSLKKLYISGNIQTP